MTRRRPQNKSGSNDRNNEPKVLATRRAPSQTRVAEEIPFILENKANPDYALLDSGNGLKLERYGPVTIVRPEEQAIWQPALESKHWKAANAVFTGDTDEEGLEIGRASCRERV